MIISRLKEYYSACPRLGVLNTFSSLFLRIFNKILRWVFGAKTVIDSSYSVGKLRVKQVSHPIFFRYNSSDLDVFFQIFVINEYKPLTKLKNVKLILDCGANVGYSTVYFLSQFPDAHVIAIEPDKRNYELLKRNVSPYGSRVSTLCAAIWSYSTNLKVCPGQFANGCEWATVVRECEPNEEADINAYDIESILRLHHYAKIDILKIDIEGSESIVFSNNYENWINRVRVFAIELHGEACRDAFHTALGADTWDFSYSNELTIAQLKNSAKRDSEAGARND